MFSRRNVTPPSFSYETEATRVKIASVPASRSGSNVVTAMPVKRPVEERGKRERDRVGKARSRRGDPIDRNDEFGLLAAEALQSESLERELMEMRGRIRDADEARDLAELKARESHDRASRLEQEVRTLKARIQELERKVPVQMSSQNAQAARGIAPTPVAQNSYLKTPSISNMQDGVGNRGADTLSHPVPSRRLHMSRTNRDATDWNISKAIFPEEATPHTSGSTRLFADTPLTPFISQTPQNEDVIMTRPPALQRFRRGGQGTVIASNVPSTRRSLTISASSSSYTPSVNRAIFNQFSNRRQDMVEEEESSSDDTQEAKETQTQEQLEAESILLAQRLVAEEEERMLRTLQHATIQASMTGDLNEEDSDLALAMRLQRQETEESFGTPALTNGAGEEVDPDEMTYEDLLELGERMGNVAEELWRETGGVIVDALPVVTFVSSQVLGPSAGQTAEACLVCLSSYERDEVLKVLPCSHVYHGDCIGTWLESKDTCPLCKVSIVPPPSNRHK